MLSISVFLAICVDNPQTELEYQRRCMRQVLRAEVPLRKAQGILRDDRTIDDVCELRCVQCTDGQVQSIIWDFSEKLNALMPMLDVKWAPPTVKAIHLARCAIPHSVRAAHLPRDLEYLYVCTCLIVNKEAHLFRKPTIDMRALPNGLRELYLIDNCVVGTVNLTNLPAGMQIIKVQQASITDIIVDNAAIPGSLLFAEFSNTTGKIRKHLSHGKKMDERIIIGVSSVMRKNSRQFVECTRFMQSVEEEIQTLDLKNERAVYSI